MTAELSVASIFNVDVPFTVSGTATGGGTDYSITGSPITIPAGSTSQNITITINDDVLEEYDETVIVTMGTPTNAAQGADYCSHGHDNGQRRSSGLIYFGRPDRVRRFRNPDRDGRVIRGLDF